MKRRVFIKIILSIPFVKNIIFEKKETGKIKQFKPKIRQFNISSIYDKNNLGG